MCAHAAPELRPPHVRMIWLQAAGAAAVPEGAAGLGACHHRSGCLSKEPGRGRRRSIPASGAARCAEQLPTAASKACSSRAVQRTRAIDRLQAFPATRTLEGGTRLTALPRRTSKGPGCPCVRPSAPQAQGWVPSPGAEAGTLGACYTVAAAWSGAAHRWQGLAAEGDERFHGYKPPGLARDPASREVGAVGERGGQDEL